MIAYFNTLNAEGGVNGRKIVLTNNLDDGGSPSQFTQDVHTLIDQDHVFAAAAWPRPGSPRSTSSSTKTPTYGYNVVGQLAERPQPVRRRRLHPDLLGRVPADGLLHQEGRGQVGGVHQLRPVHRLLVRRLQRLCQRA